MIEKEKQGNIQRAQRHQDFPSEVVYSEQSFLSPPFESSFCNTRTFCLCTPFQLKATTSCYFIKLHFAESSEYSSRNVPNPNAGQCISSLSPVTIELAGKVL